MMYNFRYYKVNRLIVSYGSVGANSQGVNIVDRVVVVKKEGRLSVQLMDSLVTPRLDI